ncbi:hypothetical protein GCM10022381_31200 [Leifsonia kafniensis]|uniref:Uncharacterized protein n=1 Tax=Leifsonia kafniensis TaxID=475957 RepID=A0ABP7KTM9_9MICO
MSNTTTVLDTEVAAFAAAIRTHLDDLPAEDVDDLTGGLEADLLEQASDHDGTLTLGDPELYAAELRASAGFPERSATIPPKRRWREHAADARADAARRVRATPVGAWLIDFFVALRPAWWLLRGWAMYQIATVFLGTFPLSPAGLPAFLAAVVVSVQWGRGKWLPTSWLKTIRTVISIVSVIALPFMLAAVMHPSASAGSSNSAPAPDLSGLWIDGARVGNIFAYDADGNPLSNVQLFNQDGDPLTTVGSASFDQPYDQTYYSGNSTVAVPFLGAFGGRGWNVFPLDTVPDPQGGEPDVANARAATPPFAKVPSLPGMPTPAPTPTPTPPPVTDPPADPAGGAAGDAAANAAAAEAEAAAAAAAAHAVANASAAPAAPAAETQPSP